MHHHYPDLIEKLGPPIWWDECGVPRYAPFNPELSNDIYANQVALVLIACQRCHKTFKVCMTSGATQLLLWRKDSLIDNLHKGSIHYGDPPNISCCPAGPTMNCLDLKVLEFWVLQPPPKFEFKRMPEFEIDLPDAREFYEQTNKTEPGAA